MKVLSSRRWLLPGVLGLLAVFCVNLKGQELLFPQPEPEPAALPVGDRLPQNLLLDLTRSQDFSAARVSSYHRQGGPRDNFWIPTTGEEVTLAEINGPGAITHIWTTHRGGGHDLILRIYWEGNKHPSVEAPIGDFFGVAMGLNATMNSYPIQVSSEGRSRNCWWNMPFNRSARVTVTATKSLSQSNLPSPRLRGEAPRGYPGVRGSGTDSKSQENLRRDVVPLYFYIDYRVYPQPIPDVHYFHARFSETDPPVRGKPVTLLEAEGDGHFVGVVMGHRTRMPCWFGEGDDIITVDGKVSFLGTGTEDYFCDAWGFRVFSYPYYGAPVVEGRNVGDRHSVYRFHIQDPIPFRKTFKLEIEHWPWLSPVPNSGRGYYSSLGFWYQKTVHRPWPRLERIICNEPWDPDKGRWHVAGALEAEDLQLTSFRSKAGPDARPAPERVLPNLSGDHMLLFDSGGDGEFTLAVPVEEEGNYTVKVYYAQAPDFGIVRLRVNGKDVGEPVDTFLRRHDIVRPLWPPKQVTFPDLPLKKGRNEFTFSVSEKNPNADAFRVGLDCLVLETP